MSQRKVINPLTRQPIRTATNKNVSGLNAQGKAVQPAKAILNLNARALTGR